MIQAARRYFVVAFLAILVLSVPMERLAAQVEAPQTNTAGGLTVESLKADLKAVQEDPDLDATIKSDLVEKYGEAISALEAAALDRQQAAIFEASIEEAPKKTEALEAELKALDASGKPQPLSTEERALDSATIKALLDRESASLALQKRSLQSLESSIATERSRPDGIATELPKAQAVVRSAETALIPLAQSEATDPLKRAEAMVVRARQAAAESAIEKLEQEQLSGAVRIERLVAERDLERRKVANLEARVKALQNLAGMQLEEVVRAAKGISVEASKDAKRHPDLQPLARELAEYSSQLERVAKAIRSAEADYSEIQGRLDEFQGQRELLVKELEYREGSTVMAEGITWQRNTTGRVQALQRGIAQRQEMLSKIRLEALRIDTALRRLTIPEADEADEKSVLRHRYSQAKGDLLRQLEDEYRRLVRSIGSIGLKERQLLEQTQGLRALLDDKLFWVRTAPPIDRTTFTDLPAGLKWMFGPGRLKELGTGLREVLGSSPVLPPGLLILAILVYVFRRRLRHHVAGYSTKIRRVSTDRYSYTLVAVASVLIRALPAPLFIFVVGRRLGFISEASTWLIGVGLALTSAAPILFVILFLRELTRKEGMAEAHFAWSRQSMQRLRHATTGFAVGYLPADFVVTTSIADTASQHLHSLVRLAFIFAMLWSAYWSAYVLSPKKGVLRKVLEQNPDGRLSRFRYGWWLGLISLPLAIVVMLALGYMFAAFEFTIRFELTLIIVVGAVFLYELLLRWFSIRERKLALAKLLEARRAKREARASEGEHSEEDLPEVEEDKIDLILVGTQTRQLLRSVVVLLGLLLLALAWGGVHPIFKSFDVTPLFWSITFADLMMAALIVMVTLAVAKNLPGILEIAILQTLQLDAGSRYAISTLARYAVVAIGFLVVFSVLNLEWSRFGWIAAALSVGLGFGLQEVVANFVCGIILLFERPMRLGDIVTVGEVSGRVTKIRMRATTITDWDRKEYLVPNKEFITGRLLNWTLTNRITRITVQVGVAYGSDTDLVAAILEKVAARCELVLDDPAPIITFRNFGDSSLDFDVRCCLPDAEHRLQVYNEMHSEIHRLFKEEGIEIPFPQRDLHIRSGWGGEV